LTKGCVNSGMNTNDVIEFFDRCAPWWDDDMIRNESAISQILDYAGIRAGIDVLDVACGTGVLFPDYISRGITALTGIDISPEMSRIAQSKFPDVDIMCADVTTVKFTKKYDAIVVYNAFPHFVNPQMLIQHLANTLNPGGRLTIAHGMSKETINLLHHGAASKVSVELMHEDSLAELMSSYLNVDVKISDSEKYIVSGTLS